MYIMFNDNSVVCIVIIMANGTKMPKLFVPVVNGTQIITFVASMINVPK